MFNIMVGITMLIVMSLSGFILGKPLGFLLLKYFNIDIINNKFLGIPIYFEIGVLLFIIIGFIYIFFDIIKENKKITL